MFQFEKTIHINRPQQEVFDFLSDPANDTKWRDSAVSSEVQSEGPMGVGSKIHSVDKLMGRKLESTAEISAWDPPNRYGQKTMGGPMPFEFTIQLTPDGEGTQLTMQGQAELGGFFKMAEGLVGRQMEKQLNTDLQGLKRALEGK